MVENSVSIRTNIVVERGVRIIAKEILVITEILDLFEIKS
jgi:hypothetical protein